MLARFGSAARGDPLYEVVEFSQQGQIPTGPELLTVNGYDLLAVPSLERSNAIYIMLWPKSPLSYMQIFEGNCELSRALQHQLIAQHKMSPTVSGALSSHLTGDAN